jgi:hypothetical protein
MRKIATPLIVLALMACLAIPAMSAVVFTETFSYPDGNLAGNGVPAWTTFSGAGTDLQVVAGTGTGLSSNSPDDSRGFAVQSTTQKTYWCMNLRLPAQTPSTGMTAFAFLIDATTTNFFGRAYIIPTGSTFTVGVSPGSCNAPACTPAVWGSALAFDHTYVLTVSYDPVAGSSELWVDAGAETDPKITTSVFSGTAPLNAAVQKFGFRQGAPPTGQPGTAAWSWVVDNLGVGTTFNDACGNIPTENLNSTWGRVKQIYRK